jgi:predicted GNAT family N-acyltransferase
MEPSFRLVPYGSNTWEKAIALREEVLRKPLGSFFTKEELEEERVHLHIVGFIEEELLATAVLVLEKESMKMQRVAVAEEKRNVQIGSKMLYYCETIAREKEAKYLYCHARNTAVRFYRNNGYEVEGDYFDEDGIPHLKMTKKL